MIESSPHILGHLECLADATRSRILLLLDGQGLTVSELRDILQLPQSTVSRHLKALGDSALVTSRGEGASNIYTMATTTQGEPTRRLWSLVREQVEQSPAAIVDQQRLQHALSMRRTKSQEFFSTSAGQWDRLRTELFGDRFHLAALAALVDSESVVGDLGCGTGQLAAVVAPFAARVVAVDNSPEMLAAARVRLRDYPSVDLRRGTLEALPIDTATLDVAAMMLVLHHVADPGRAIAEAARVLKPGGRVLLVDMVPHDREHYRQHMGHAWLGFAEATVRHHLSTAGFADVRLAPLPTDARSKGPGLFVAAGRRV